LDWGQLREEGEAGGKKEGGEGGGREERPMKSRGRSMSDGVDLRENAR